MYDKAEGRPEAASQIVLPAGTVLSGKYRVSGPLAEPGPHAIVYRAATASGEVVAIKELFPRALLSRAPRRTAAVPHDADADARLGDARRRFLLESQLLESTTHAGLPRALAHFEENGTAYLVTELLEGETLESRLQTDGKLSVADAGRIALALLDAIELLHSQGILHRDIAPENIMLGRDGPPRLLGLATPRQLLMYGMPGAIAPRTGFAAIEMYGSRGKGPWTDVHSVAALLYLMLTGTLPASSIDRAAGETLVPASRLIPGIPWALDTLIVKALSQRPEERPHSAERFHALLEEALGDTRVTPEYTPAVSSHYLQPLPAPTPPFAASGITPLTLQSLAHGSNLPAPFALSPRAPVPVSDEEIETFQEVGAGLTLDPSGSMTVVPIPPSPVAQTVRIGGIAIIAVGLLFTVVQILRGGGRRDDLLPTTASAVTPTRNLSAPPVVTPPPAEPATPSEEDENGSAPSRASSRAPEGEPVRNTPPRRATAPAPRQAGTPQLRVPAVSVPIIANTPALQSMQPVPAEDIEQLREQLASGRARVEASDYAAAQRIFRGAITRVDNVAGRHLPSASLTALRRDLDQAAQRAREACTALNAIAARRNGRVLTCE